LRPEPLGFELTVPLQEPLQPEQDAEKLPWRALQGSSALA
jgi:hypothetical protein